MSKDDKIFCIKMALAALVIIIVVITVSSSIAYVRVKAFQHGYEQVTVPGYSTPVWQKIR